MSIGAFLTLFLIEQEGQDQLVEAALAHIKSALGNQKGGLLLFMGCFV